MTLDRDRSDLINELSHHTEHDLIWGTEEERCHI